MNLIELAKMKLLSGGGGSNGGGSSGGTAEKVYLFRSVTCTNAELAKVDAVPEAGKYYVLLWELDDGTVIPKSVATYDTGTEALKFCASTGSTLHANFVLYKHSEGWSCLDQMHQIFGSTRISVVEYT